MWQDREECCFPTGPQAGRRGEVVGQDLKCIKQGFLGTRESGSAVWTHIKRALYQCWYQLATLGKWSEPGLPVRGRKETFLQPWREVLWCLSQWEILGSSPCCLKDSPWKPPNPQHLLHKHPLRLCWIWPAGLNGIICSSALNVLSQLPKEDGKRRKS